ncbi:MAG TPA: PQQ-binding-like beta-propeller repeat protein [Polyangiaceae bacterium]|jgi:hypothetical protein
MRARSSFGPCSAIALCVTLGHAAALDPSTAHTFVVGSSPALAACAQVDASSSRRSPSLLPTHPIVSGALRLGRGIRQAPASDSSGNLLIAFDDGRLSEIDQQGHSKWSAAADAEIVSAPIITSNGSRIVVTQNGEVHAFDEHGLTRCRHALPGVDTQRETLAIPTPAGGVLLANNAHLLVLNASCELERDTHTTDRVVSILASARALIAVLADGSVLRAAAIGGFERVAHLGGKFEGAALRDGELLALADRHTLVSLDLASRTRRTLAVESGLTLRGSPLLLADGGTLLVTDDELLSVRDADGRETARIPLAAGNRTLQRPRAPSLIVDAHGTVLSVQPGQPAISVSSDGKLTPIEAATCGEPFPPVPLGAGRVAIACRSGQLFYLAEKAP